MLLLKTWWAQHVDLNVIRGNKHSKRDPLVLLMADHDSSLEENCTNIERMIFDEKGMWWIKNRVYRFSECN